jgi:DNA mismatch repair protein MutS2
MRVAVEVADLEAPTGTATTATADGAAASAEPRSGRRGGRGAARPTREAPPRGVPATLDLRGARVDEALETLDRYIDQAAVAGAGRLTIVHGHGSGALRDAVRALLSRHPLVKEWRPGERGEGGDGASIVVL